MFEHAVYSVISPEGCASILWRTGDKADVAADAMQITAQNLKKLGVIDRIIEEPVGGAHRDPGLAIAALSHAIEQEFVELEAYDREELRRLRRDKFLQMGSL